MMSTYTLTESDKLALDNGLTIQYKGSSESEYQAFVNACDLYVIARFGRTRDELEQRGNAF
jgi:hypothetical protein